ncbi:MAG: DUF429 domain-containing protein [Hyphomicrobiaceae bacterium]
MTVDPSLWVAGVDGCPAGWLVVLRNLNAGAAPQKVIMSSFGDIPALPERPAVIAVDIPIGLPDRTGPGGRGCDVAARKVIGARQSSIFSVPARAAVMKTDYRDACRLAFATSTPPRKVSKQCFNIFPKIREVDAWIMAHGNNGIYECHPEVAFWALNGETPLTEPKKVKSRPFEPGLALRRSLLQDAGFAEEFLNGLPFRRKDAGPDDLLDACAAAWTAERIHNGSAIQFPDEPLTDGHGIPMTIWA